MAGELLEIKSIPRHLQGDLTFEDVPITNFDELYQDSTLARINHFGVGRPASAGEMQDNAERYGGMVLLE